MPKYDVFISYAHLDDEPDLPKQEGWVSVFQEALRSRLSKELGRRAEVWWDQRELRGDRVFDETIRQACADSAVMLSVVSRRYLASESCREEVQYFTGVERLSSGESSRLITVRKTRIDQAELTDLSLRPLRDALEQALGYPFFYVDEDTKRTRELHIYDEALVPKYMKLLEDLAQDLAKSLRQHEPAPRRSGPVPRGRVAPSPGTENAERYVLLGGAASDVQPLRDSLQLALADRKLRVLSRDAWSDEHDGAVQEFQAALDGASVVVHVLGSKYGAKPDGSDVSLPELHFNLAEQAARLRDASDPLSRIVWLTGTAEGKGQQAFVERLEHNQHWSDDDELLKGTLLELTDCILDKHVALAQRRLQELERAAKHQPAPGSNSGTLRHVYVISDRRDHDQARAVESALNLPDWEVLSAAEVTQDAETEQEREACHQAYLRKSDAFLLYHGQAKFAWVRAQAEEMRRVLGPRLKGRTGLYVAQPLEGPRSSYQLADFLRLNAANDEPRANLEPLIERLRQLQSERGAAE
jgi:hypothetical protein